MLANPLNAESIGDLTKTIHGAIEQRINIHPDTLAKVQSALTSAALDNPELAEAAKRASAATYLATIGWPRGMVGPIYDTLAEAKGSAWRFRPIATNTGPDNYKTLGVTRNPEDIAIMRFISDPPLAFNFGPAFFVVSDLKATIDGWHLKHIIFQNMTLSYNGGALICEDVCFLQCTFEFSGSSVNVQRLVGAIKENGWVSLSIG